MASSKLKAKSIARTSLYYGKYEYRLELHSPHIYYTNYCKDITDFSVKIAEIANEANSNHWPSWRKKPNVQPWEYELIKNVLNLSKKYKLKHDYTLRRENETCCVYTNNVKIVKEVMSFAPDAKLAQVDLMPTGVMEFKRTPPAKYRAYMTNNKMPADFKDEFLAYLERTPDIVPSNSFYTYLHRSTKFAYQTWLWDKYFVDYNDEKNLMMMTLMFPEAIGKKYKLVQK